MNPSKPLRLFSHHSAREAHRWLSSNDAYRSLAASLAIVVGVVGFFAPIAVSGTFIVTPAMLYEYRFLSWTNLVPYAFAGLSLALGVLIMALPYRSASAAVLPLMYSVLLFCHGLSYLQAREHVVLFANFCGGSQRMERGDEIEPSVFWLALFFTLCLSLFLHHRVVARRAAS